MNRIKRAGPLAASDRQSAASWPGVLAVAGDGAKRLVVNAAGTRYALQGRIVTHEGEAWAGRSYARLSTLRAAAADVQGLAEACEGLPEDPADVRPDLVAARRALCLRFEHERRARRELAKAKAKAWRARGVRGRCLR